MKYFPLTPIKIKTHLIALNCVQFTQTASLSFQWKRNSIVNLSHTRFQYQGDELKDTDIPTYLEAKLFCTTFGKFLWVVLQPFFYAFRPLVTYPKKPTMLEFINTVIQIIFDAIVVYFFGERLQQPR